MTFWSVCLGNLKDRGVVLKEGQTLKGLYEERTPLYEKYAQLTVDEETLGHPGDGGAGGRGPEKGVSRILIR